MAEVNTATSILRALGVILLILTLLVASVRDLKHKEVERIVWLPACIFYGIRFICLIKTAGREACFCLTLIIVYGLMQEALFSKFYGRADSHAFLICGIYFIYLKQDLTYCFMHMTFSFLILTARQLYKGNVGKNFALIEPVAFIPYIFLSFSFVYLFCCF